MTRKRRYLISAAVFGACVCLAIGTLAIMPQEPGITKANFDRIALGMTFAEVEGILGRTTGESAPKGGKIEGAQWWGDDGALAYVFFFEDNVEQKVWSDPSETFTDKVRRWLNRPKTTPPEDADEAF